MKNIKELENNRRKLRKNKIILYIIMFVVVVLFDIFIRKDKFDDLIFFVIILYSGFCILIVESILEEDSNELKKQYKKRILVEALKNKFNIISYEENSAISKSVIEELNIMSMGNTYKSNGLIRGNYGEMNFECANIDITSISPDIDSHNSEKTKFKGLWFIFEFNKSFKSNVKVINKKFVDINRGLFSDKINKKFNYFKDYVVKLNSEEFNKQMKVYANKQEDVFEILTDTNMAAILKLNNNISGKILLYFIGNKLHIGIHNYDDLFKLNVFTNHNYNKKIDNFSKQLNYVVEFIEFIKSNTDIFNN